MKRSTLLGKALLLSMLFLLVSSVATVNAFTPSDDDGGDDDSKDDSHEDEKEPDEHRDSDGTSLASTILTSLEERKLIRRFREGRKNMVHIMEDM